jgi:hypothetical protein
LQQAGLARQIGISFEDAESALLYAEDERIQAIEFPLGEPEVTATLLARAQERKIFTIVRGVARSTRAHGPQPSPPGKFSPVARAVIDTLKTPGVSRLLLGTTSQQHLLEVTSAVRASHCEHSAVSR